MLIGPPAAVAPPAGAVPATGAGKVTIYTDPGISGWGAGITTGPDGALRFANYGDNVIGRVTTSGRVTNYTGAGISFPDGIVTGPDGPCGSPTTVTTRSGASPPAAA